MYFDIRNFQLGLRNPVFTKKAAGKTRSFSIRNNLYFLAFNKFDRFNTTRFSHFNKIHPVA